MEAPLRGPIRFGRYLLLERVAVGGMAEIFLAADDQGFAGHRLVTIKRIRPDYDDPDYREFFITEARVSLQCCHPNVPQVHEAGELDGVAYLAMEYIRGHTLLDFLRKTSRTKSRGSVPLALAVGRGVAAALEHIHGLCDAAGRALDVIHRDVTPQNVMLAQDGGVKLIDFGIVRSAIQTHRTQAGVVKGKFSYMAPEVLDAPGCVDRRADLFATGVLMHEILAGRPLFRGRTEGETMERILRMPIPILGKERDDVPLALEATIRRALARNPDERYQSAADFLEALEEVADLPGISQSVVGLRREVRDACGEPNLPIFDPIDLQGRVGQRIALGSDSDAVRTDDRSPTVADPGIAARFQIEGDQELSYFLDQAGVVSAAALGGFEDLADSDA